MNNLVKKSFEELKKIEEESRAELFALRFQLAMGNLEKPHRIKELRKKIARILTIKSIYKKNKLINTKINLNNNFKKKKKK